MCSPVVVWLVQTITATVLQVQFRIDYTHHRKHKDDTYVITSRDIVVCNCQLCHTYQFAGVLTTTHCLVQPIANPDIQPVHFSNEQDERAARHAEREMRPELEESQTGIRLVKVGRGQTFRATCKVCKRCDAMELLSLTITGTLQPCCTFLHRRSRALANNTQSGLQWQNVYFARYTIVH